MTSTHKRVLGSVQERTFGTGSIWQEERKRGKAWVGQFRVGGRQHQRALGYVSDSSRQGVTYAVAARTLDMMRARVEAEVFAPPYKEEEQMSRTTNTSLQEKLLEVLDAKEEVIRWQIAQEESNESTPNAPDQPKQALVVEEPPRKNVSKYTFPELPPAPRRRVGKGSTYSDRVQEFVYTHLCKNDSRKRQQEGFLVKDVHEDALKLGMFSKTAENTIRRHLRILVDKGVARRTNDTKEKYQRWCIVRIPTPTQGDTR